MGLNLQHIHRLWERIRQLDTQLAPYHHAEDTADQQLRIALRDGSHEQILAAYDHRFKTRHRNWTLTRHWVEERRWLLAQLPKRQS